MLNLSLKVSSALIASSLIFASCSVEETSATKEAPKSKFVNATTEKNVQGYKIDDGVLKRYIHMSNGNTTACSIGKITEGSFRLRQIETDKAAVYFKMKGDLWILNDLAQKPQTCPSRDKQGKVLVANIQESKLTPAGWAKQAQVVNLTLDTAGKMQVWGVSKEVVARKSMTDISYNNCYGKSGKPFSSYLALGINNAGHVIKVKPSGAYKYDATKNWESLKNFKTVNQITCQ